MKGSIEVEIGIRVKDVPPQEVEAFLLAFAHIARNSHGVMNLNPETQKALDGMPKIQKALQAAPLARQIEANMAESRRVQQADNKRVTAERKAEALAVKRMERQDAQRAWQAEKDKEWADRNGGRAEKQRGEREKVMAALGAAQFRVVVAAQKIGMTPAGLYQKMHRLGIYARKSRKK